MFSRILSKRKHAQKKAPPPDRIGVSPALMAHLMTLQPGQVLEIKTPHGEFAVMRSEDLEHVASLAGLGWNRVQK